MPGITADCHLLETCSEFDCLICTGLLGSRLPILGLSFPDLSRLSIGRQNAYPV